MVTLPRPVTSTAPGRSATLAALGREEAPKIPKPAGPPIPSRWRDSLYWVLLLALLPLVSVIAHEKDASPLDRLKRTLTSDPSLKARVEALLESPDATLDHLFALFPGGRLDSLAHLPRDTNRHWLYAGWAGAGFFILIAVCMASGYAPAWKLLLAALFTATFGIGCLLLFHDFIGHDKLMTLEAEHGLVINLVGFTLIVGLGEELCKSLPVIYYLRTDKAPTLRGACFWGMASGIGFGLAEAVHYAATQYNGIAPGDTYLIRFASCVTLHAVWSASVGITLFQCRRMANQVINAIVYLSPVDKFELGTAIARVLGVAMLLHGSYDALLTHDHIVPALMVALGSFAWLGWQIESAREEELALLPPPEPEPAIVAGAAEG